MNKLVSVLPLTPKTLFDFGIDNWSEFGYWPVAESQFRVFADGVDEIFEHVYQELEPGWREAQHVDVGFFEWLKQFVHAQAVRGWANTHEMRVDGHGDARRYFDPSPSDLIPRGLQTSPRSRLLGFARVCRRRWRANRHLPLARRSIATVTSGSVWSLGEMQHLKRDFVKLHGTACDVPVSDALFPSKVPSAQANERAIRVIRDACQSVAVKAKEAFDLSLPIGLVQDVWISRLAIYRGLYGFLTDHNEHWPATVMVGSPGNPLNRVVALAARAAGANAIVFQHGHNPGYTRAATLGYGEFSLGETFVCPTAGFAASLSNLCEDLPFTRRRGIEFVSLKSDMYEQLRDDFARGTGAPDDVALVVGYPASTPPPRLTYGYGDYFAFKIPLEVQVVRALKRAGYRVLYKPHPDTVEIVQRGLSGEVEIVTGPFETALKTAGLLVFTYPLTTALGIALCSDRPIVLIDQVGRDWVPHVYHDLASRCALVRATFNERNLISLNDDDFLEGVSRAPSLVSNSYFEKYMSQA